MDERSKDEVGRNDGVSRRSVLKGMGAGAAIAWSAPILQSIASPAFAQYGPDADCAPATCATFVTCGAGGDCICISCSSGGGICVPGQTLCQDLEPCGPNGECGTDACCENQTTCCGPSGFPPLCVPFSLRVPCQTGGPAPRRSSGKGATLGGR
jgi:hypothetical protein